MLRYLRQELSDERWIRNEFLDSGVVLQISTGDPPPRAETVFHVALNAPDTRPAKVLSLLRIQRDGDIRHRVLHAIVEPRRAHRRVARDRDVHSRFTTRQPLGAELIVRQGQNRADAKLAVQLVECPRPGTLAARAPRVHRGGGPVKS